MFQKKTLHEYDIAGKRVLLRTDYNVPMQNGTIVSNHRIVQSLPTIRALQEKGCRIVICSHLGRPQGPDDKSTSLRPIAKELSALLAQKVRFSPDCIGDEAQRLVDELEPGHVLLLENLRYHPEEEQNNEDFAQALIETSRAEVFVQDGFGVVHRAHASTDAVARKLPAVAGLLLAREVDAITNVMLQPARPLMAVIGGAKIADKIDIITTFISSADIVVIGGAMANTFLKAIDIEVGASMYDADEIETARDIIEDARLEAASRPFVLYLPQDGVVSEKVDNTQKTRIVDWDAHTVSAIENYPKKPPVRAGKVLAHEKILDIGPISGSFIAGAMQLTNTVVWNGTMGVAEVPPLHGTVGPFAHGTELVIDGMVGRFGHKPYTLVGGGDTAGYIEAQGIADMFDHVSTGGGACLELMSGKELPGVAVLWDK